jgi:hypothetical protein
VTTKGAPWLMRRKRRIAAFRALAWTSESEAPRRSSDLTLRADAAGPFVFLAGRRLRRCWRNLLRPRLSHTVQEQAGRRSAFKAPAAHS